MGWWWAGRGTRGRIPSTHNSTFLSTWPCQRPRSPDRKCSNTDITPPPPPSPPPSHTFLSDHVPPYLPASFPPPHWGHLGRGLGSHRAKSRRSLTRTDFPPLTSVERREAQNTQDATFSWERDNGTLVHSAKVNLVINFMVVLWWMCDYICLWIQDGPCHSGVAKRQY